MSLRGLRLDKHRLRALLRRLALLSRWLHHRMGARLTVTILKGDCREVLRTLPEDSVHCVVTSPPYWGLRDYGVAGQLGLEPTLGEHIAIMVDVFREVRRVMRKDATLWLNYGDCYATKPNGRSAADTKAAGNDDRTWEPPVKTTTRRAACRGGE